MKKSGRIFFCFCFLLCFSVFLERLFKSMGLESRHQEHSFNNSDLFDPVKINLLFWKKVHWVFFRILSPSLLALAYHKKCAPN